MSTQGQSFPGLDHYEMKASYGRLTGVSIGLHAIADGYLLMHVGVGCKDKVTHLLAHDWEVACNLRQGWTEVGDRDLIVGATARVGPYVRSWSARMSSGFVGVVSATFLDLAGEDIADEVRQIAEEMPMPVVLLPASGYDGDTFDGYAAVCRAVIESLDWKSPSIDPRKVSLLGYLFDRYEGDHAGNFKQLATLLKGIGLTLGPSVLGGTPYAEMATVPSSGVLVSLPYLQPVAGKMQRFWRRLGRAPLATDLPMGLGGTSAWLRQVAQAARLDPTRTEAYIQLRERKASAPLQKVRSRSLGKPVAVMAEAPLAAGLCGVLLELGMRPVLVATQGTSLGGADALHAALGRMGHSLPAETQVLEDPSLPTFRENIAQLLLDNNLDGVLSSATTLAAITSLNPEDVERIGRRGPFLLEVGFPCRDYHALIQLPFLGYGGVVTLAQRILQAPRIWDDGRTVREDQR